MAIVSSVLIVLRMDVKNFAISFYKLRKGIVYELVTVKNVYYFELFVQIYNITANL